MSLWQILGGIGSIGTGMDLADDIRGVGESAAQDMGTLAGQLQEDTRFTGYGVTTGLGTSTVSGDGTTNLGVGPEGRMYNGGLFNQGQGVSQMNNAAGYMHGFMSNVPGSNPAYQNAAGMYNQANAGLSNAQQGAMNASQQAMANSMADRAGREQSIYDSAMAMQQPGLDAQRASNIAREAATGRRGLMGSQFGGTGEDAAVARAQAQAQNQAAFQAMGQAESEMMNQANMANMYGGLGQGYAGMQGNLASGLGGLGATQAQLGQSGAQIGGSMAAQLAQMGNAQANFGLNQYNQSYTPMQMQMQMLGLGGQNADRAQTGQLTGANLAAQLGLGAIQSQVNAETTAADLYAKLFGAGANMIGGMDFGDPGGFF